MEGMPISNISFEIRFSCNHYTFVHFEIIGGTVLPEELSRLVPPKADTRKGIILSGRGPTWLYSFLTHYYHPYPWVGVYDPRLGAIVVMSHAVERKLGSVVDVQLES